MTDDEKKVVEMLVAQMPTSHPNEVMNNLSAMMHWPSDKTNNFVKALEETGLVVRKSDGFEGMPSGSAIQIVKYWWVPGKG